MDLIIVDITKCCDFFQALKVLRTGEFTPFVVFVAAPNNISIFDEV